MRHSKFSFKIAISFIFFIFLYSNHALAQKKSAWKTKIGVGAFASYGNVEKFDLSSSFAVSHADSTFEYSSYFKSEYGEADHKKNDEEYSGGIKFDYLPHSKLSPFMLLSGYNNEYKGIDLRVGGLLGAKWTFIGTKKSDLSISAAGVFEYEKYTLVTTEASDGSDSTYTPDPTSKLRLSIRPKFEQKIGTNFYFSHVTFYQPKISDFGDYRIDAITSIESKLTNHLKIKLSYEYEFDSMAEQREKLKEDSKFKTSILIDF